MLISMEAMGFWWKYFSLPVEYWQISSSPHTVDVREVWDWPRYNTMQGRQAKHVQIASYAKHSTFKSSWFHVFRHDFISKLWLPLQKPSLLGYHETHESLVPKGVGNSETCHCGFRKLETEDKCFYCIRPILNEIKKSVAEEDYLRNPAEHELNVRIASEKTNALDLPAISNIDRWNGLSTCKKLRSVSSGFMLMV